MFIPIPSAAVPALLYAIATPRRLYFFNKQNKTKSS